MFFFYYVWGFCYLILNYTHVFIENFFYIRNNPFFLRKRTFKYISYFEKLFLVLFYKRGWFDRSIANLYRKKDIIDYRRKYYPIINSFHDNYNKEDYNINNLISLNLIVKQYVYYVNISENKKINYVLKRCFLKKNNVFVKFLMLQYLYSNKYYNLNSYFFFHKMTNLNIIKLNRIFFLFLVNSDKKLILFDLDKWYDWYLFNFSSKNIKYLNLEVKLSKSKIKKNNDFKNKIILNWIKILLKYKLRINSYYIFIKKKFKSIIYFNLNLNNVFKIKLNSDFSKLLKYYIIKFSDSSITKHINSNFFKKSSIQFLRKNRIFNKGRYSRNRQLYRTGVYWCLWLNIIMVYGLYFIFYRFTFNFGYFWWGILFLAYSTIFSRIIKFNFHNIFYIILELSHLIKWYGFIFQNIFLYLELFFKKHFKVFSIYNYISNKNLNKLNFLYNYYYYFISFVIKLLNKRKKIKIVYMWQGMKEKDKSFFRYKTILHWFKEIFRLIVT